MTHTKQNLRAVLERNATSDFTLAAKNLLRALGYHSERTLLEQTGAVVDFIEQFPAKKENSKTEAIFREHVGSVRLAFQITSDEIASVANRQVLEFEAASFNAGNQQSFLFFTVELRQATYPRGQYAQFCREINKRLKQPTVVLFRTSSNQLTLAFVHRREHKRDLERDVLGHVSLIREIDPADPHRAHLDILTELHLAERLQWMSVHGKPQNFDGLLVAWLEALNTEELNRQFYRDLFRWFERAVREAKFPNNAVGLPSQEEQVIRLITRILFIWFIKEKGLVPEEWFVRAKMEELLDSFGGSDYYRAILQNLFFATLNTEMATRGFSTQTEPSHRVFSRYRYESLIRDTKRFKDLMKRTPFINGGLFDCLDDEESRSAGGKRIDMFSDPDPNDGSEAAQARRDAWQALNVPDSLFFDENQGLFSLLNRYKFTIEENTPIEQEVALDPELLGKVFENLLAAYNPETRETARKQTGSYYTPRAVVDYMVDEALVAVLAEKTQPDDGDTDFWQARLRYLLDYADAFEDANELFENAEKENIVRAIAKIKVLDPAVGSGAFPMGILHKLTLALRRLDPNNELWEELQRELAARRATFAFDTSDQSERDAELREISATFERYRDSDFGRKLHLIQNGIYGVDIQPIATQIAKLRFFISLAIDQEPTDNAADNYGIRPLPNLETRFVAADTLLSLGNQLTFQTDVVKRLEQGLNENRERHFHATTRQQKLDCKKTDEKLREKLATELENAGFSSGVAEKIARWNPYDQNASTDWFDAEYMFGVENGFDVVIGNPPYIQLQKNGGKLGKLYKNTGFATFARTGDIYQLFYERGCRLASPSTGILVYITSNSWLKAKYGEHTRRYFAKRHTPLQLLEMGKDVFENAIVDTNILIVRQGQDHSHTICKAVDMDRLSHKSFPPAKSLWGELRLQGEKPWSALSAIEQSIMDKMESVGTPLKDWDIAINYGIKTGYNAAFIIDNDTKEALIAEDPRSADIIKPVLRGRDIKRYRAEWAGLWLIDTHNGYGSIPAVDIDEYPTIKNHLDTFYPQLKKRQDKGRTPYHLRNCAYHEVFRQDKLFWMHMAPYGRFAYSSSEIIFCNQKAFVVTGKFLKYLCAILNSHLITWQVENIAVTTGMGLIQWDKFVVENLPIPKISNEIQQILIHLVDEIIKAKNYDSIVIADEKETEIDRIVYALYGLTEKEITMITPRKKVS